MRASDITKYDRLQLEAQERSRLETKRREQEKALRLAQAARAQAEELRLKDEREAAERREFVRELRQRIARLDPKSSASRKAFLDHIRGVKRLDGIGAAKKSLLELQEALLGYESAWACWRWPLLLTGPCDRAKARALKAVDEYTSIMQRTEHCKGAVGDARTT